MSHIRKVNLFNFKCYKETNKLTFNSNVIDDDMKLRQKIDPSEKRKLQMWRSMLTGDCRKSVITDK